MMLNLLIQGFLIGLFVSVPVGPIAVLCIQRTLTKSLWNGFLTGLGAACSDVIYALVAGLGMSFIVSFITTNQYIIQIIGSIVIFLFGIYLYRSNPMKGIGPAGGGQGYVQDFITSFFMTISNPMIVFLFIGLFARFNFINDISFFQTLLGILSILLGATTWWLFLVSLVNLFRRKINVRNLWIVNRILGGFIIIFALTVFVLFLTGKTFY
jgi:threonine/homoserine/homoserine lactone efflux protein